MDVKRTTVQTRSCKAIPKARAVRVGRNWDQKQQQKEYLQSMLKSGMGKCKTGGF